MSGLVQAVVTGLMTGGVYALLALSIALIFKTMDTVNFATASMGAFCAFLFFEAGTVLGLGWGAGLVAGVLGAVALGWAVERGIVGPLGSGDLFRLVLATMGLDILLNNASQILFGSGVQNINAPLPDGGWNVGGVNIDLARLTILAIAVAGTIAIALVLRYTNLGIGMRAYAQDPQAATLMGVPARTVSRWTWIMSSLLGLIAAVMVASVSVLSVGFLQGTFISAFTAAVLGGLSSLPGAVAGGFILGVLEALSISYAPRAVTIALPVLIILVVLMIKPAGLVGALIGVVIGLPSLRIGRLYLAIATLALCVVAQQIFFEWSDLTGGGAGIQVPPPNLLGSVYTPLGLLYISLAMAGVCLLFARNLLRGRQGRAWNALRASPLAASSLGMSLGWQKVGAFGVSGAMVGCAGVLYAHAVNYVSPQDFTLDLSIVTLVIAIIGGQRYLWGAALGSIFVEGVPEFLRAAGEFRYLIFGAVFVAIMLFFPEGFAGGVAAAWRRVGPGRRRGGPGAVELQPTATLVEAELAQSTATPSVTGGVGLAIRDVRVAFGGVTAVDSLSVDIVAGSVVGLVGPNGAGKTTLLRLPAFVHGERRMRAAALETAEILGLADLVDERVENLAYGVQKRVDVARAVVARPRLLLLDEPAAGLTPDEGDDLVGRVLVHSRHVGATVVLVEHNIELVMRVTDRVVALNFGRVIADDVPEVVRRQDDFVEAYLGS